MTEERKELSKDAYKGKRPIGNKILLRKDEIARKVGSIYLPDTHDESGMIGTAILVGPDCKQVKPGDRIIIGKYLGTPVDLEEVEHTIIREDDVLLAW